MRTIPIAFLFVGASLLIAPGIGFAQQGKSKKIYCWEDSGQRVCGDALPASAVNQARDEINARTGLKTGQVERALTPEEIAERARLAKEAEQQEIARAAEERRRQAMVGSFSTEEHLVKSFEERKEHIQAAIEANHSVVQENRRALVLLLQRAAEAELMGKPVSKTLVNNINDRREQVVASIRAGDQARNEIKQIDTERAEALEIYRQTKLLITTTP